MHRVLNPLPDKLGVLFDHVLCPRVCMCRCPRRWLGGNCPDDAEHTKHKQALQVMASGQGSPNFNTAAAAVDNPLVHAIPCLLLKQVCFCAKAGHSTWYTWTILIHTRATQY